MKFNKESKELIFNLKTDKTSPVGKHNLFCRLTITQDSEPIVSRAGGVQLQIDKPPPPPPEAKAQPKPEAKPQPVVAKKPDAPKAKPLTRLEKLRLAAKERAEQRAKQEGQK